MKKSSCLLIAILLTIFAAPTFAQTVAGMGGLSGSVRDASGASVPGAQVIITNADKGIRRTLETNEAGIFSAPALVPANGYQVTINKPGFSAYGAKDLEILVGQQVDLPVVLQVAATTTQVEVLATTPLVEPTKTDVSQVVESQQIVDLPINGRRVDSFVLLTPGVTNDATYGLLTFRGIAGGNSFLVDGGDTTEQYYNENAGRTRIHSQISQDAVQEFQVVSSNFSAEYGRATGGVVNTVTRSGTNQVHGTGYWFFRNQDFNARDRYATFNPPETRHTAGASIGGPFKKDKLFYFFNVDVTRRDFPIASSINRPTTVDPNTKTFVGCGSPATPAQCAAINTLLPRFFGQIPRQANQELALGKLDWRPTERNSISATFNFLHFVSPNGVQTAAAITTGSAITSNADDSVRMRNGRLSWTSIPATTMVNEFRFGWFTDRQADDFDKLAYDPGTGYADFSVASQYIGAIYYVPRVQPNETRLQFADNLSWTKGTHTFKFGVDIANNRDYSYYIQYAFGNWTYQTVTNFALDYSGNTSGGKHWQTYAQGFGNPVVDATIRDHGFYAQDQYRITPSLVFNYGLRYEYAALPQPKTINPDFPQTGHINTGTLNLAPRLGIAYSFDKGKMVLRAGWGMYHARFPGSLVANLFTNNGVYQLSSTLQGGTPAQLAAGPVFPTPLATAPSNAVGSSSFQFLAPNATTPYTEQGTIALERQLAKGVALTASYVWSRGLQMLGCRDLNMGNPSGGPITYTIDDAGGNVVGTYTTPVYMTADRINPKYQRIIQDENGINSYYNALVVSLRKRFSHGFLANLSYTWAHEIDDGQGAGSNALFFSGFNSGSSPSTSSAATTFNGNYKFDKGSGTLDQRHRMVINFVEQPTFTHRDGAFFKYVVNNWQLNGIVTMSSGRPEMPYIYTNDMPLTGMAYNYTLNGFGGSGRVPFWPVNALYTPAYTRGDARLSKVLPIGDRYKLYLNFEVFNISNSIRDTSEYSEAFTERGKVLTPYPAYGVGNASGGFPDGTNARRMQVGARVVF